VGEFFDTLAARFVSANLQFDFQAQMYENFHRILALSRTPPSQLMVRSRMNEPRRIETLLNRGGQVRVDLLRYAVKAVILEPLVLFVVNEYRLRPSVAAALAIYDAFSAQTAIARVDAAAKLPTRDLRLTATVRALRAQADAFNEAMKFAQGKADEDSNGVTAVLPTVDRGLFNSLIVSLWEQPQGALQRMEQEYDETLTPEQNIGQRLSASQRNFVSQVWRPQLRPMLVEAGFWQLSSID